jgi:hypothetical protein
MTAQALNVLSVVVVVLGPTTKLGICMEPTGARLTAAVIGVEDGVTVFALATM